LTATTGLLPNQLIERRKIMPQIFVDGDDLLYIRNDDQIPQHPYWKTIMGLSVCVESILHPEPDDDGLTDPRFFALLGHWDPDTPSEQEDLLALQMPNPLGSDGAVVEEVVQHLRNFLDEEEITDLIDHIMETNEKIDELEPGEEYTPFSEVTPEDIIGGKK